MMFNNICLVVFVLFAITLVLATLTKSAENQNEILIVVSSSSNVFHRRRAELLRRNIYKQHEENAQLYKPQVLLLPETFPEVVGSWTILPIMSRLADECQTCKVVIFCDDNVEINLTVLDKVFKKLDLDKDQLFGGRTLKDKDPTVVHHYNFKNDLSFQYPDFSSGFFVSMSLLKKLSERFKRDEAKIDFSIDAYYEFAQFVHNEGQGINFTKFDSFCGFKEKSPNCAVSCSSRMPKCDGYPTENKEVFVAVKTCEKYHKKRLSILKKTWGRRVENIRYFSDVEDETIPTIYAGVPNTEHGHCKKFFLILEYAYELFKNSNFKWLFVADDDTLLSMERLLNLLSCYDPSDLVFLGERYGYGVVSGHGYDYVTLGGGMAISRKGLETVLESKKCGCAKADAPDDMTMGMCLHHLQLPVVHSPLFHQARPIDYPAAYLENQLPVSFHRHWDNDAVAAYGKWLESENSKSSEKSKSVKKEL